MAHGEQVLRAGIAHGGQQWITLCLASLGTAYTYRIVLPIDIIEAKRGHLASAQSVDREQHEDGAITHVRRTIRVKPGQQALDLRPGRSRRKILQRIHPRPPNGLRQRRATPSLLNTVTKERAQRIDDVANCDAPPSLLVTPDEVGIDMGGLNLL